MLTSEKTGTNEKRVETKQMFFPGLAFPFSSLFPP
jgi:hypothetical protein